MSDQFNRNPSLMWMDTCLRCFTIIDPYHVYTSESHYNSSLDAGVARATQIHTAVGGVVFRGSQLSI